MVLSRFHNQIVAETSPSVIDLRLIHALIGYHSL
jgi:hypothetical protein